MGEVGTSSLRDGDLWGRLNEMLLHYIKCLQIQAKRARRRPQAMLKVVNWEQVGKISSLIPIQGQKRHRFLL